ncbi:GIY-YIG catalytic domain protein, partial [Vibrio parahaemolyticus V-223/04]
IPRQKR